MLRSFLSSSFQTEALPEPRTVLRSLILVCALVFLSGWLGIVAQPAEAQQTVTLSGQVTDAAGQAVSGATVDLNRLPDWVFVAAQETDENGAYRFSVSPGRYHFAMKPQRGPLIPQDMQLSISTDTTRNIVLETGVTLSGRVTGPAGQPVGAWLSVYDDAGQEISFGPANASGHYSLGVPVGTYRIEVYSDAFPDKTVEGVEVTQDTVLNITLDSGVLLEGKVVDDRGRSVPDAQVCAHLSTEEWWQGICSETELTGSFQLRVPPAKYVVTVHPVFPLRRTRLRLDASGERVADLILTVSRHPMPFVPDDPPKAALISIAAQTAAGEVTLSGAAGSVAPQSAIFALTLETGHFTTAQATADGSFTATLFAPAGTSVLIKADPIGTGVAQFVDSDPADPDDGGLSALPGTILRVADPSGPGIPIGGAGKPDRRLPAWTFHGSINTHTLAPGDLLRVRGTVRVDSPVLQGISALQVETSLGLEPADGASLLHGNSGAATTFLTPTGLPLERWGQPWATGFGRYRELPLVKTASTQAEAEVNLTLALPPNLPTGYYRPFLQFGFPDLPAEDPLSRPSLAIVAQDSATVVLPTIKVGNPAPPCLDWVLLLEVIS